MNARGKTIDRFRRVRGQVKGQSNGLMLWLSVVLHSALILLPLKAIPEPPEEIVLELSPPITVTRLPERSRLKPDNLQPDNRDSDNRSENSTDSLPATLQPVAPLPQVIPQPITPPPVEPVVPSSIPEPSPIPEPPRDENAADTLIATENITTENTTVESEEIDQGAPRSNEPANEADVAEMAAIWDGFLSSLPSGLAQSSLQQILSLFGQPGQEELFFADNQQPKTSVVSHYLLEDKRPDQVFEEVVHPQLNDQQGFEIQAYGEFAGGPVYQITQGEIVHYLNIVPLNERSGSVLIVGDRPPNV